jgi:hypothetical protein
VPCGSDIAIALHTPPHRAISLALVAQALGATQDKKRGLRRMVSDLAEASTKFTSGRVTALAEASTRLSKGRTLAEVSNSLSKGRKAKALNTMVKFETPNSSAQDDV